jgi:hypothetical protein
LITIGLPTYGNFVELWFTLESLRMYQDLTDVELLVVDNMGSDAVKKVCRDCKVRYELWNDVNGTGPVRNKIFELARNPFVLVLDSHVLLWHGAIAKLRWWLAGRWEDAKNLIHGPLVMSSLQSAVTHYNDQWRSQMWGTWGKSVHPDKVTEELEIEMMGCGLFGCRRDSWLGFTDGCRGFAGVEGVIHKKYKKVGRKVLCLPFLKWVHRFRAKNEPTGYPLILEDRIRNFVLGFNELEMDKAPLYEHFGKAKVVALEASL